MKVILLEGINRSLFVVHRRDTGHTTELEDGNLLCLPHSLNTVGPVVIEIRMN